ncbi:MAG: PAS domain-containing protein, partial [Ilumatobacteraceae bacterium]|nr:PAS domain-containing protein [Ilumatobacteraceae bacterium]
AAATRGTGRPVEKILGRTNRELGMPEQLCDRWEAAVAQVFRYGTTEDFEFTFEGRMGVAYYAARLVPEFEADGRIYQVLGVTRDITQLRRQESSARESAERLQLALAAAQAGAWSWDIRSGAIEWSAENYVLYGRSPSLGPPLHGDWFSTVHPDDRANVDRAMRDTLSHEVSEFRTEFRVLWPDGEMRWILGIGKAEFDEAGEAVRMIGINLDIHDRKRIEKALQDEDRRKDEFLATLSHELRNPLAPLTTGLEVLRLAPAGAAVAVSALRVMERQLTHLVRLVDDLMDVSRIRSGKIEMKVEVVSIGDVVRQAVEACQPLIEKALQRLDVVVEPTQITVNGDEMRLTQVLTNVLSNAAKYTADGGHILLQAGIEEGQVLLRVVDDGVGIAPGMLCEVFELFAQADTSRHRAGGGLGIGLSLVRNLVTLHGGTVRCDSRGLGLGTTVEIRLPLLMSAEADVIVNADPAPQVVTITDEDIVPGDAVRRVLLIDDNVDGAETMASMLRLSGYQVWTAYDGDAGLTAAMAVRPASIVVDIGLPIIDGYGVARRVRLEPSLCNVRLIALTGWGSARDQG